MKLYRINSKGEVSIDEVEKLISSRTKILDNIVETFAEKAGIDLNDISVLQGVHQPVSKVVFYSTERAEVDEKGLYTIKDAEGRPCRYKLFATVMDVEFNLCDGLPIKASIPETKPYDQFIKEIDIATEKDEANQYYKGFSNKGLPISTDAVCPAAVKYGTDKYSATGSDLKGLVAALDAVWDIIGTDADLNSNRKFNFVYNGNRFPFPENMFAFYSDIKDYLQNSDLNYDVCNIKYKGGTISFDYKHPDRDEPLKKANIYLRKHGNQVFYLFDQNLEIYEEGKRLKKELSDIKNLDGSGKYMYIRQEDIDKVEECLKNPILQLTETAEIKTDTPEKTTVKPEPVHQVARQTPHRIIRRVKPNPLTK